MQDAARLGPSLVAHDGERVVVRLANMQHHGQSRLFRDAHLRAKRTLLVLARREVVVVIEPDLAQTRRALIVQHRTKALLDFGTPVLRVMRVKTSCNAHPRHARRRLASTAGEKPLHGKRGLVVPL